MREIKFRAWDVRRGEYRGESNLRLGMNGWCYWEFGYDSNICEPGAFLIEQYTGLKDKNGKEIYEGDILALDSLSALVIFENGAFCFKHQNTSQAPCHIRQENTRLWEVIGNIHENKDLIPQEGTI